MPPWLVGSGRFRQQVVSSLCAVAGRQRCEDSPPPARAAGVLQQLRRSLTAAHTGCLRARVGAAAHWTADDWTSQLRATRQRTGTPATHCTVCEPIALQAARLGFPAEDGATAAAKLIEHVARCGSVHLSSCYGVRCFRAQNGTRIWNPWLTCEKDPVHCVLVSGALCIVVVFLALGSCCCLRRRKRHGKAKSKTE